VFGVPGGQTLAITDAVRDAKDIRFVTTRHEGAAACMAGAVDDLEVARAGKLPTLIVQGQQQAGLVGEFCARAFGAAWFTKGWFKLKFINMLQVFDPVEICALVTQATPSGAERRKVELDVWARRQSDGKLTTVGWASCEA